MSCFRLYCTFLSLYIVNLLSGIMSFVYWVWYGGMYCQFSYFLSTYKFVSIVPFNRLILLFTVCVPNVVKYVQGLLSSVRCLKNSIFSMSCVNCFWSCVLSHISFVLCLLFVVLYFLSCLYRCLLSLSVVMCHLLPVCCLSSFVHCLVSIVMRLLSFVNCLVHYFVVVCLVLYFVHV